MNQDKLNSLEPLFGSWYVESKVSEGKNSKFYKVYQPDGDGKHYAGLKIVRFPSGEQELSRVIASGKYQNVDEYLDSLQENVMTNMGIMRSLSYHKNIVPVHNFTVIREVSCFYLLCLVDILTPLSEYLSFEAVSKNDVITIGKDICHAMIAFREKGIIHHDITPENIYVDASGNYKLGDFGVYDYETGISEASVYRAPELYEKNYLSDVSSDIYSLGILLYKLLNNNRLPFLPPYPAPISLSDREQSFARCMRGEAFPTPANADYKLGSVISKATAFNPDARYLSPMAMLTQLESYTPYTNTPSPSSSVYQKTNNFEINNNDIHFGSFDQYPDIKEETEDYYEDTAEVYEEEEEEEAPKKHWYFLVFALVIVLALVVALIVKSGSDGKDKTTTESTTTTTAPSTTEPTTEETTTEETTTEETTTEETTTEETTTEETTTETTTEETTTETTTESTTEETTTEEPTEPYTEPTLVTTNRKNGDKSEDGKTYMKISSFNLEEIPDDEFFDEIVLSIGDNLGENLTTSNVYIYQMVNDTLIQKVTATMTAEADEDLGGDLFCTVTVDDADFYFEPENYQYFLCFEEGAIVSDSVITLPLQVRIEGKF